MGTTLTGTTPQDTYDSLIKVTDNGPLSGTAKYLSDGLGNDSTLALSTGNIGIATTSLNSRLTVQGGDGITIRNAGDTFLQCIDTSNAGVNYLEFKGSGGATGSISYSQATNFMAFRANSAERMRITSAGNVGIGTSAPTTSLEVRGASPQFRVGISAGGYVELSDNQVAAKTSAAAAADLYLNVSGANTILNRDSGNVGIGTSSPDQKLNIVGSQATAYATSSGSEVVPLGGVNLTVQNTATGGFTSMRFVSLDSSNAIGYMGFTNTTTSIGGAFVFGQRSGGGYAEQVRIQAGGGISFNGDTAAANALDDYEEGTWTPVFRGATTAGSYTFASVGEGKYTKIGNQVTVWTSMVDITQVSAGTGAWEVAGLPYAIGSSNAFLRISTGSVYVRQAAVARTGLIATSVPSSSSVFLSYSNGALDIVNYDIATDFAANMDIGLVFTYTV